MVDLFRPTDVTLRQLRPKNFYHPASLGWSPSLLFVFGALRWALLLIRQLCLRAMAMQNTLQMKGNLDRFPSSRELKRGGDGKKK